MKSCRCTSPLRHVAIVIRLRVDSSIPRIAYIAYFCTTIIKFRNSYRFTCPSNSRNFLPRRFVCIFKIEKRSRRISSERNFLSANNRNRTYKVFFLLYFTTISKFRRGNQFRRFIFIFSNIIFESSRHKSQIRGVQCRKNREERRVEKSWMHSPPR